jgi:hypothetical protein
VCSGEVVVWKGGSVAVGYDCRFRCSCRLLMIMVVVPSFVRKYDSILFCLTYALLYELVSAVHYVECLCIYLRRKLQDLLCKKDVEDDLQRISRHAKLYDNVPSHLAVIL